MTKEKSTKTKTAKPEKNRKANTTQQHNAIETFEDAFIHELSDMRNAELQLIKALPQMAKAATNPQLAEAFETHVKETMQQVELIDQAVEVSGIKLKQEKCDAMEGLIREGKEVIQNVKAGPVRDSLLIAAGQKVEHYEIASYGCLVAAAKQLGLIQAAEFLDQILDQEKQTDQKLNQLAEQGINQNAQMQDSTQKGNAMPRYDRQYDDNRRGHMPERDNQGRFMSDDDRGGYGRGNYYSDDRSSRYDQDDNQGQRYSRSGRDDNYGYDDNRSNNEGGRGHGGWFGDPEGHAEAARQRGRGYSSASNSDRDYDDNRSRSGSGRGHGGWFGDPEGHAEAARQRGQGYQSSSRDDRDDDYDDNRGSRSRNIGSGRGWFGDPQGHAEAGRHSHDNYRSNGRR